MSEDNKDKKEKKETDPFINERLARKFCNDTLTNSQENIYSACHWQNTTYLYDGKRYVELTEKEMNHRLRQHLMRNQIGVNNHLISNIAEVVKTLLLQDRIKHPNMPFYIGQDPSFPQPDNLIAYQNGMLNLEAFLAGKPSLISHTPLWISPTCLPYDYNPSATCPLWEKFLMEVFEGDTEQAGLLQEWFGYCMTHDVSFHKFLMLCGVARAGKGTICDILKGLIGEEATAGFTLFQLIREFGLAPLVGKQVAFCGEAELKGCKEKQQILEKIKGITAGDYISIPRKFQSELNLVLPTRLVIACNELPTFYEPGGALSTRLLLLKFNRSFVGCEDYNLKDKLRTELPGIANWALEGLRRLRSNKRFTIPQITQDAINSFQRDNSPALAFIQDCLQVENRLNPGGLMGITFTDKPLTTPKDTIQNAYSAWRQESDLQAEEDKWNWFWRDMKNVLPKLKDNGKRGGAKAYCGIAIKETIGAA